MLGPQFKAHTPMIGWDTLEGDPDAEGLIEPKGTSIPGRYGNGMLPAAMVRSGYRLYHSNAFQGCESPYLRLGLEPEFCGFFVRDLPPRAIRELNLPPSAECLPVALSIESNSFLGFEPFVSLRWFCLLINSNSFRCY